MRTKNKDSKDEWYIYIILHINPVFSKCYKRQIEKCLGD